MYFSYCDDFGNHGRVSRVAATTALAGGAFTRMRDARGQNFAGAVTRTRTSCNRNHLTTVGYQHVPGWPKYHQRAPATAWPAPSHSRAMQAAKREPGVTAATRSASRIVSTSVSSGSIRILSPA